MQLIKAPTISYAEIGQQSKVKFSYAVESEGKLKELFSPVRCRDFFNECCLKQWTGKDYTIYGFNTNNVPVFTEENPAYLLCYNFPEDKRSQLEHFLGGLGLSFFNTDVTNVIAISLPVFITRHTYYISYITFLVRCVEQFDSSFDHTAWKATNEKSYANAIYSQAKYTPEQLYLLFADLIRKNHSGSTVQGVDNNVPTSTLHNSSGIVAVFTNKNNEIRKLAEEFFK